MEAIAAQRLLIEQMSDISERCWYAGWLVEAEYKLWQAVIEGPMQWGHGGITQEDIASLLQLSEIAGGWIAWPDDAKEVQFVPLKEWQPIYASWAKTQQSGRK